MEIQHALINIKWGNEINRYDMGTSDQWSLEYIWQHASATAKHTTVNDS